MKKRKLELPTRTEAGRAHWTDLQTFMDIENSPTVVVTHEADVADAETRLQHFLG